MRKSLPNKKTLAVGHHARKESWLKNRVLPLPNPPLLPPILKALKMADKLNELFDNLSAFPNGWFLDLGDGFPTINYSFSQILVTRKW